MSTQLQLPSFFIPYVESHISDEHIKIILETYYDLGDVNFIDRIQKFDADGYVYFWVFVHFRTFKWDDRTFDLIRDSKDFKNPPRIYYEIGPNQMNGPYWKLMFNKATRKPSMPEIKISREIPQVSQDFSHHTQLPRSYKPSTKKPTFQFIPRVIIHKKREAENKAQQKTKAKMVQEEI
jgi:hypothetical protein